LFFESKDETIYKIVKLSKNIENEKGLFIINIRSDHGGKFISDLFESFYEEKGYHHNFLTPRTPQQNKVVEKKNRSFQKNDKNYVK
jgi:hypothetical protein